VVVPVRKDLLQPSEHCQLGNKERFQFFIEAVFPFGFDEIKQRKVKN
jgi:hypothetical protein